MDKKIILSVLIVALIGIVAATYQINTGDVLNPLASVKTEDESPVTEVFTAPKTDESAKADAEAQAKAKEQADAQAKAKAQAEADAKAKAQAEADAQTQPESQDGSGSQSTSAGTTQKSSSLIGSGDTITVEGSNSGEQSSNNAANSAQSSDSGSNQATSDSGSSQSTSDSGSDQATSDSGSSQSTSDSGSGQTTTDSGTDQSTTTSDISDQVKSTIQSIIQPKIDSDKLILDMDSIVYSNNEYQIKAYTQQHEFAGTFYVNLDTKQWHYIDKDGNYFTEETPTPGEPSNGALDTSQ